MSKTGAKGDATAADAAAGTASVEDPATGLEATVAAYLRAHPDFFDQHADVLGQLHLVHSSGAAVSLIQRQVSVLRTQLETERGRLSQLIARARDYESFSARLHALVLQVIAAPTLEQVRAVLEEALMREFSAQAVTLKLFAPDSVGDDSDPVTVAFRDFLERKHALCGPLDEAKNGILFGDVPTDSPDAQVQCAVLVPIHANGYCGVLAIGAADPERFRPDMRTDLLDRLGEIVSQKLLMLPPEAAAAAAPAQPATAAPQVEPEPSPPPKRKRAKRAVPE
ncbi:DUF484 family protein [uncultured Thiodictyon sp.]|uniref:DUF484 family protein n=1 Tax=uncultured Thiodictyon sp. TaxID=1846217 RepID=UPI0025F9771A|nr:DUF484 family protein [uncultured Thiodictyon sp.]